jgi:tetratricopeptide (TPR) repeat protein
MNHRRPLALALALLAGCSHHAATVPNAVAAAPKSQPLNPEALKRTPKPETFVAYGDFSAREAAAATAPAEQEQLRERARRAYQEALKIDPANLAAQRSLGRLYAVANDIGRAKETFESALKAAPDDGALWFDLGMTYARAKEWGPAVDHLKRATELEPENRSYFRYLGFTLARAGRYEESLAAFGRYDGPANAHYHLAQMLEHLGQVDGSKTHLQLALTADPHLDDATRMLVRLSGAAPAGTAAAPAPGGIETVGYAEAPLPAAEPAPRPATQSAPSRLLPPLPPLRPEGNGD